MPSTQRLYSIEQAAALLSLSDTTVGRLARAGLLKSMKVGRRRLIPSWALDQFADKCREGWNDQEADTGKR